MTGTRFSRARSMILQIFWACASPRDPPSTVKSWAKTQTSRPPTRPKPVITPSPGMCFSLRPKSSQRVVTSRSSSWKVPSSMR